MILLGVLLVFRVALCPDGLLPTHILFLCRGFFPFPFGVSILVSSSHSPHISICMDLPLVVLEPFLLRMTLYCLYGGCICLNIVLVVLLYFYFNI